MNKSAAERGLLMHRANIHTKFESELKCENYDFIIPEQGELAHGLPDIHSPIYPDKVLCRRVSRRFNSIEKQQEQMMHVARICRDRLAHGRAAFSRWRTSAPRRRASAACWISIGGCGTASTACSPSSTASTATSRLSRARTTGSASCSSPSGPRPARPARPAAGAWYLSEN